MTSLLTLEAIQAQFERATCPEDVFGADPRVDFRQLAKVCHPDQADADAKDLATTVFAALVTWKEQADRKLALGTYGDRLPLPPEKPPYVESELTAGKIHMRLVGELGEDGIAKVHEAKPDNAAADSQYMLKIAIGPSNNDLLQREFRHLSLVTAVDPDHNLGDLLR